MAYRPIGSDRDEALLWNATHKHREPIYADGKVRKNLSEIKLVDGSGNITFKNGVVQNWDGSSLK